MKTSSLSNAKLAIHELLASDAYKNKSHPDHAKTSQQVADHFKLQQAMMANTNTQNGKQ